MLSAPLPRVYEETQGGKVVPLNASNAHGGGALLLPIGGTDFNAEELAKISKETSKKLESEVLAPMERWMNAYALVQVRAGRGEAVRLTRRRSLEGACTRMVCQYHQQLPRWLPYTARIAPPCCRRTA